MHLEVLFVRHAESYANRIKRYLPLHFFMRDPSITTKGIEAAKSLKLSKVDVIFCSNLKRAKQTAQLVFPESMIYVLPGVDEISAGLDNIPLPVEKQFRSYEEYANLVHLPLDVNCRNFISYLKRLKPKTDRNKLKVAIFTHQHFIAEHTDEKQCKNLQVVKKSYNLN